MKYYTNKWDQKNRYGYSDDYREVIDEKKERITSLMIKIYYVLFTICIIDILVFVYNIIIHPEDSMILYLNIVAVVMNMISLVLVKHVIKYKR